MAAMKRKIALIFLGIIAAFFLLEFSLHLIGYIYYRFEIASRREVVRDGKDAIRILCLGDSQTFGMGAERGYDYPAQLERILNENNPQKKYAVYNLGYPGLNSSQVLKQLEENIEKYKPDIITLLIGNQNRVNLDDSNYYLFADNVYKKINILLMRMRTYKLFKMLKDAVAEKKIAKIKEEKEKKIKSKYAGQAARLSSNFKNELDVIGQYFGQRRFNLALEKTNEILRQEPNNQRALVLSAEAYIELEKYDLALANLKKAILNNPEDAWTHRILGKLYYRQGRNNPAIKEKNFELSIKELEQAISYADNPQDKVWAYYTLSEVFFEQKKADLATGAIENALKYEPDNSSFRRRLRVVSLDSNAAPEERKVFDKLLYYDLDCIANTARNRGIKLILLSYPNVSYLNEIRKQIADKYNIPFIDISSIFSDLLAKCNYKDLFSDDGSHPNANGYRIIAENIYKVINSIKF